MEFQVGKVVRETQYFAEPFEPPAWRARWVELITVIIRLGIQRAIHGQRPTLP